MTRNRVASHALRLPLIIALTAGMIGCIALVVGLGVMLWNYMQPNSETSIVSVVVPGLPPQFIPILIYFAVMVGITIVTLLPARLLWIALERVVERYWEDDWQRWQLFKADLHKRS